MELLIDERDQSLEGGFVALSPFDQQSGDFRFGFRNPDILCSSPLRHTSRVERARVNAWSLSRVFRDRTRREWMGSYVLRFQEIHHAQVAVVARERDASFAAVQAL
jgi:hypothetical protein